MLHTTKYTWSYYKITKNILYEANYIDGLDARIDIIIQQIEKMSDIFTSLRTIWSR